MSIIYRDMDQTALDFQYNNRAHVSDPQRYLDWYKTQSEIARARVSHVRTAYGPSPAEQLDIFTPAGMQARRAASCRCFRAWRGLATS